MSGINKAIIVGHLGADPEVRYLESGTAVGELRIATSETWTDKSGQKQERTEWHRVVVWGRTAENCAKFLGKGSMVGVEGSITTEQWNDKDGNKRYTTKIKARQVTFLQTKRDGGGGAGSGARGDDLGYGAPASDYGSAPAGMGDDIPF